MSVLRVYQKSPLGGSPKFQSEQIKRFPCHHGPRHGTLSSMNTRIRERLIRRGHVFDAPVRTENLAFFDWFREVVLGLDSDAYRRAFWREACATGHTIGHVPRTFRSWQRERGVRPCERLSDALAVCLVLGGASLFVWLIRRAIDANIRHLRRPAYYERERERRLALGKTRRAILCRRTTNPRPSMEALRQAWRTARDSPEAALRFGGMLEDLECYVDNRAVGNRETGWRGRRGGIKRLLEREAPDLFEHYAAVMRYKALARRFRQICGLDDPTPIDAVLPAAPQTPSADAQEVMGVPFPREPRSLDASARTTAATVLNSAGPTIISLEAEMALWLDPDCIAMTPFPSPSSANHPPRRLIDWLRRRMRNSA